MCILHTIPLPVQLHEHPQEGGCTHPHPHGWRRRRRHVISSNLSFCTCIWQSTELLLLLETGQLCLPGDNRVRVECAMLCYAVTGLLLLPLKRKVREEEVMVVDGKSR